MGREPRHFEQIRLWRSLAVWVPGVWDQAGYLDWGLSALPLVRAESGG